MDSNTIIVGDYLILHFYQWLGHPDKKTNKERMAQKYL